MAKSSEPLAIERAVRRFEGMAAEDQAATLKRLQTGTPKSGLVDMAYVEEIANECSPLGRKFLVAQLEGLVAAPSAPPVEPPPAQ